MSDTVDVILSHPFGDRGPGERVSYPVRDAEHLVDTGRARYATKPDAKAAGADPDTAVTADR